MAAMREPRVITRAEHTISRRDIDPEALKVLYRLRQFDHIAYLVGGSVRDLLLVAASQGLRHRHFRASVSSQETVPQLLDHRPTVPAGARQVRAESDRGRDLPAAAPAGRRSRARPRRPSRGRRSRGARTTTTPSERLRKTRSGATSRSTRSSTTSPRSRSSTTSTAWTICTPASSAQLAIRKCASRKTRCACCARWRWRHG